MELKLYINYNNIIQYLRRNIRIFHIKVCSVGLYQIAGFMAVLGPMIILAIRLVKVKFLRRKRRKDT